MWPAALTPAAPAPVHQEDPEPIDATLVEVHSENKAGTAPTYTRGFGFHPMFCFADATGEALAARLRDCPILCVTGRDGSGQLAAWMRSP